MTKDDSIVTGAINEIQQVAEYIGKYGTDNDVCRLIMGLNELHAEILPIIERMEGK